MSAITQTRGFRVPQTSVQRAIAALGADLSEVATALCAKYSWGDAVSMLLTVQKLGVACQGAYLVDEDGHRIPIKLDTLTVLPVATGQMLVQEQADQLMTVDTETASEAMEGQAIAKAARLLRAEKRKQIQAALKIAARKAVCLEAGQAQLRELDACEPKQEDYPDQLQQLISWNQRRADLEISIDQAEMDGDIELAKTLRKALNALSQTPPSSFETDRRRWSNKRAAVESQVLLLKGAYEEVAHLNAQQQALLAEEMSATETAMPKQVYRNMPIPAVRKALTSGWPTAFALYAGESSVKTLAKHGTVLTELCCGALLSAHPPGRVQLTLMATATLAAYARDVKAMGAEDAAALAAAVLIVVDQQQSEFGLAKRPVNSDCLAMFDKLLKERAIANVRLMLANDFAPQGIAVSPGAASWVNDKHRNLQIRRTANDLHPMLDALLMRMREIFYSIAGLLHLWRGQTGPLSVGTMGDATDIGEYLIEQFERSLELVREEPKWMVDTRTLCKALSGHVAKQQDKDEKTPFAIRLSNLHAKAKRFGLTRARVDVALKALLDWGWVKVRQDGLDTVFDLDPHRFAHTGTTA
ncbi:DUF3987 domain-containing protein [Ralstonia holmesii]|uniref:DUF3987 domain-containing protein n=1 Tax=Ralstonia holmesii TaxID=3058602 RepID=UPI003F166997